MVEKTWIIIHKFTDHHHEDAETMLLVPTDLHEAVRHTGGAAIIKDKLKKGVK